MNTANVTDLFAQASTLENAGSFDDAEKVYTKLLRIDTRHAASYINLGTIYFNKRQYDKAERCYRKAIESDPNYALAHFDLANTLDELGKINEAETAYLTALRLAPTYGDPHYNLALLYERQGEKLKALKYWRAYTRLDSNSPWKTHALRQIKRIVSATGLNIVVNNGPAKRSREVVNAGLFLVTTAVKKRVRKVKREDTA